MLTKRGETVLKIIVGEYITTATPVPSESIARHRNLGVSPATIRNEMARLENEGYISRPHISAGGVPVEKGYRYYVEYLADSEGPTREERREIKQLFQEARRLEDWMRLATALLAQRIRSMSLAVMPQGKECRIRHLELIALQEFFVLLVLVLEGMKVRQQLLPVDKAVTQDELTALANRLNSICRGLTSAELGMVTSQLSPVEEQVCTRVKQLLQAEADRQYVEMYTDGVRHLMAQPEFSSNKKMLSILEALEEKSLVRSLLNAPEDERGVKVVIGKENRDEVLRECSVVLHRYGIPNRTLGTIGVIGPTRMHYSQAIPTLNFLSSVMSELLEELYA